MKRNTMVEVEVVLEQCPSPPPLISKKLSNAVRLFIFMIQKRSRKLAMPDLQVMVRRGKILGKSFNDLMLRHNTALGCTSHDVRMSFVSPREYEFSCSSSPPHRHNSSSSSSFFHVTKRKSYHNYSYFKHTRHRQGHGNRILPQPPPLFDDQDDVVLPVGSFKMFNRRPVDAESPLRTPVSGSSSRSIKTTTMESSLSFGSGGSCDEEDGGFHVDKAAEEFIERFYRELMMQKWMMAREPSDRCVCPRPAGGAARGSLQ